MTVSLHESEISGLRWLTLKGERLAVFSRLGQFARSDIRAVQESMPERDGLFRWADTSAGSSRLKQLVTATSRRHSVQLSELQAMADGAGIPIEDLMLSNLRGDIGTGDGTGCTDLIWRRERALVAHNEDGAPGLEGRLMLITLLIDGDVPVTAQWYPGFVPANAFSVTGNGLVWGINHVQVSDPPVAAGRHFIARALQQCASIDSFINYHFEHPSAGGYAYNIGDTKTGRVAVVEAAASQVAVADATAEQPLRWHTNHLRYLPTNLDRAEEAGPTAPTAQLGQYDESIERGRVLDGIAIPEAEPSLDWFISALTSAPLPDGVHRMAAGADPLMTLCTTAADLSAGTISIQGVGAAPATLSLKEFTAGGYEATSS